MVTPWQNNKSFEETNLHMLQNEILYDVIFMAGSSRQEIKAHKFLLASRSPEFHAMFCNSSVEPRDVIEVADIEFDVLKELLRFIYTENCEINMDSALSILSGAKKFNLNRLEEKCRTFLNDRLSAENVFTILKKVHGLGEKDIEQKCAAFITEIGTDALIDDAFTALPKTLIRRIISSDNLQSDEATIYKACKKWAVENCNRDLFNFEPTAADLRNKLGDLLNLIRFPLMSFEMFASSASKDDILSADEKVSIFHSIANKSTPPDCKFSMKPRIRKPKVKQDRLILKRFLDAPSKHWMYNGLVDSISFVVSTKAKIIGVGLFSPINEGKVKGLFKLENAKCGGILFERQLEIGYNAGEVSEEVLFNDAFELVPGELYTLSCNFKGCYTYYGTNGQKKVVSKGNLTISFIENDFSQNGTDCGEGQFHYLILQTNNADSH